MSTSVPVCGQRCSFEPCGKSARRCWKAGIMLLQDDVRAMALPVLRHRVLCNYFAESDNMSVDDVLNGMLSEVQSLSHRCPRCQAGSVNSARDLLDPKVLARPEEPRPGGALGGRGISDRAAPLSVFSASARNLPNTALTTKVTTPDSSTGTSTLAAIKHVHQSVFSATPTRT